MFDSYEFDEQQYQKEQNDKRKILTKDPLISAFLQENGLKIADIEQLHFLEEYHQSLSKCQQCRGLFACKQEIIGMRRELEWNGVLTMVLGSCPYLKEKKSKEQFLHNFDHSDIPEELRMIDLNSIAVDKEDKSYSTVWINLCKIAQGQINKGLFIAGDFGVGKTYLSIAFINTMAKKGYRCSFIKTGQFVNMMRSLLISDKNEYDDLLERIKNSDYLVFDDFGTETLTSYSRDDLLFTILDYRMENKRLTVFTSNLTMKVLYENLKYDKQRNVDDLRAKRMMERVRNLALECHLGGINKRNKL